MVRVSDCGMRGPTEPRLTCQLRDKMSVHCRSGKKQDIKLLPITSPNVNLFSIFFTVRLSSKFATAPGSNILPSLEYDFIINKYQTAVD